MTGECDMANVVKNAKTAARNALAVVVDAVVVDAVPKVKGKKAGGVRTVRDPQTASRKVKGATLDSVSRVGVDDVKRTRASWNGYSLSSLLKWVGAAGGDVSNAKALVASLGLTDTTALSTVSCQFYAGRQLALGASGNPLHTGSPADLTAADAKAVKVMAGM